MGLCSEEGFTMIDQAVSELIANATRSSRFGLAVSQPALPLPVHEVATELLPFTVRVVDSAEALAKAVAIRHAAYARHLEPAIADALRDAEPLDSQPGVAVLLAESKLDGSPLGTMRIQTNLHRPLTLEASVPLPAWMAGKRLAEATRLGITQDKVGRVVKTVLFKAYYLYCIREQIDHMVITARTPIDRQYERLLFQDVHPGMGFVPLAHVFNLPHRIMHLNVPGAQALWDAADHPMLGYMCHTEHPDLLL
jgi:hypothetical protein